MRNVYCFFPSTGTKEGTVMNDSLDRLAIQTDSMLPDESPDEQLVVELDTSALNQVLKKGDAH